MSWQRKLGVIVPSWNTVMEYEWQRLAGDLVAALKDPGIWRALSEQGAEARPSTPAEYAALIRNEVATWGKVVRQSGARID